jgi:adenosylmethionine-8-amino-7-oxononanoate aminotransferase
VWHPYSPPDIEHIDTVVRAQGSLLYLEDGKKVIDAIGSWWTSLFGHCYPPLVKALSEQAHTLDHVLFADVQHHPAITLANKLLSLLGDGKIIFSDNGSTAVETALKLSIQWQKISGHHQRTQFAAFVEGYHGDTIGAMSLQGDQSPFCRPYGPLLRPIIQIPFVDTWEHDSSIEEREEAALNAIDCLLERHGKTIASFIFEPLIQGTAGMKMCRQRYLKAVCQKMQERGILLIADEVMTGLGRTGSFLGSEKAGVHPDLICLSKSLAGGMLPLAVTFVKDAIVQDFVGAGEHGILFHGHTFAANPIACRVAEETIDILCNNQHLFSKFQERYTPYLKIARKLPLLQRARALGVVFAVDIAVKSQYGSPFSKQLRKTFWDQGVLARPLGSTVYFLPAYTISDDELECVFATLWKIVEEL